MVLFGISGVVPLSSAATVLGTVASGEICTMSRFLYVSVNVYVHRKVHSVKVLSVKILNFLQSFMLLQFICWLSYVKHVQSSIF